ncbi:MAG: RNA polymerase sigma factor [Verrucomicrobia bacterium]|nr:RNA polymerase sigma factor [Verrucomicrobiota bacterium]
MADEVLELCARAREGDLDAASELVTLYHAKIFSYLRRLCGNDDDAADLAQKTFFKVWTSIASFQGRSSFSTWIHGIAFHVYGDWRRRTERLEHRENEWWECCALEGPTPSDDAAEKDLARHLYSAVERLEEESRQAVHLHYYQGLSLQETSQVLGVAASTLKYRLRAALDFIRSSVKEPMQDTHQ